MPRRAAVTSIFFIASILTADSTPCGTSPSSVGSIALSPAGSHVSAVLSDLNCDIILILHPLDVAALEPFAGDLHHVRAENDYEVDRSRLPSGHVLLHEVRVEFAR